MQPRLALWADWAEKSLLLPPGPPTGLARALKTATIGLDRKIGPRWLISADTLIIGGNPLLLALAALAEGRAGRSALLAPIGGDDIWGYGLARRPDFLAFVARAAGLAVGPVERPVWSAESLGLTESAPGGIEALAHALARALPAPALARLPSGWTYALGRNDGERALLHVLRDETPTDARDPERAGWRAALAGALRPLARVKPPIELDSIGVIVRRIVAVSGLPALAPIMEPDGEGGHSGRSDHPLLRLHGSARRLPASGPALLEAAIEDVLAVLALESDQGSGRSSERA